MVPVMVSLEVRRFRLLFARELPAYIIVISDWWDIRKEMHFSVQHRAVPAYFHLWFPLLKRFHPELIKRISCPNTKQKLRGVLFYLTVREKEILTLQYNTGLSSLHFQGVQYCLRWNRSEFYIWEVWRRNSVKNMFAMIAGKQFESLLSGFATVKFLFLKLFSLVSNIFIIFA